MIPTRRALTLLFAWLGLGIACSAAAALEPAWRAAGWLGAAALGLDLLLALRRAAPEAKRAVAPALSLGQRCAVRLEIRNPGARLAQLRIYDHVPPQARCAGLPIEIAVPGAARVECSYPLWPQQRGRHRFGPIELWQRSPLGLFERRHRCGGAQPVRVYPNFRAVAGYQLLAAENRTGALGIRQRPRRGEGLEFHQLREYRPGDSLRQIDWKATARLRKAISREHQDERDQQILFLIDCSRRLRARDAGRSHFDAVLDAVLLAAQVALRQGDAVGLMTFGGERRWLAPRKGPGQANALMNAVYDLGTSTRSADYADATRELLLRVRKRALVVLVSNLRDEDAEELAPCLRLLSRRHLVLLASLRELGLEEALRRPPAGLEDALRAASVRHYLEQRHAALRKLERCGAILLDAEPQGLPVALVNRYLDVKAARVL